MATTLSTEEAASLMIGLDYIPPGMSLLGMTAAFLEEAEVELHNAKIDKVDWHQKKFLKARVSACQHRHELAGIYLEALELELGKGELSILTPNTEGSISSRIDLDKLAYWAAYQFGISLPANSRTNTQSDSVEDISDSDTSLSKSMASTYTTFSLLLEAFIEIAPPKFRNNNKPNGSQIASHLAGIASNYSWQGRGQGEDMIRKRLATVGQYHPAVFRKRN